MFSGIPTRIVFNKDRKEQLPLDGNISDLISGVMMIRTIIIFYFFFCYKLIFQKVTSNYKHLKILSNYNTKYIFNNNRN